MYKQQADRIPLHRFVDPLLGISRQQWYVRREDRSSAVDNRCMCPICVLIKWVLSVSPVNKTHGHMNLRITVVGWYNIADT